MLPLSLSLQIISNASFTAKLMTVSNSLHYMSLPDVKNKQKIFKVTNSGSGSVTSH